MKNQKFISFLLVAFLLLLPLQFFNAQTNFFYYNGKKILLNIKSTEVTIIFSEATTKTDAEKIISQSNVEGELEQLTNVGLESFYLLKLNEQKNIKNTIDELSKKENIVWSNTVFERKGTEFKTYNRFVAKLPNSITLKQIEELNKKHHVKFIRESGTGRYTFELSKNSDLPVMDMSNIYYHELKAEWAMPDFIVPFEFYGNPSDFYFSHQWNFSQSNDCDIDAPEGWDISTGSSDIIVAVVDLGVQEHQDLPSSRLVTGWDCANSNSSNTIPYKNGAHGMACAGLIAAGHNSIGIAGLAPNSKIMPIQVVGNNNIFTSLDKIAIGFDYARINGADIISNSWGGEYDINEPEFAILSTAIEKAMSDGRNYKGCVVLFATGNDGANYVKNNLATIEGVLAVGATDINDYKTSYSNHGVDLDLTAPSATYGSEMVVQTLCPQSIFKYRNYNARGNIWTIDIPEEGGYNRSADFCPEPHDRYIQDELDPTGNYTGHYGGTSAACPQVAGLAALVLSVNSNLNYSQVEDILANSADKVHSNVYNYNWNSGKPGHSKETGYGRINAFNALKYTLENYGGTLKQDLIISSGETWTFEPGVTVTFENNSKLKVYGTLNVSGTSSNKVTLDFQAPYWYDPNSIKFYEGSSGTVDYAEIKNGLYGIYIYKSSPTIKNSKIYNCHYGIMNYYNSPNILTNELYDITYTGIYSYKGSPKITDNYLHNIGSYGLSLNSVYSSTYVRKNTIDYCPTGVYAFGNNSVKLRGYSGASYGRNIIKNYNSSKNAVLITGGTPDLGQYFPYDQRGYNNLHWVTNSYVVKSTTSSQVMALFNYWGSSSPQYNWFYGNVEFAPLLGSAYSGAGSTLDKVANIEPDEQMLYDANELADSKSYQRASDKYKQLISDYPESKYGGIALAWSMATHQLTKDLETQRGYLQKQTTHKSELVSNSAKLWLQTLEAEAGNMDVAEKVVYSTSIKEAVGVEIRLNLANDLLNMCNDEKGAEAIFDELIKADASASTLETIDAIKATALHSVATEKQKKSETPNNNIATITNDFTVQNFPNPFNPSTTISYSLPTASNVKLEVYDVMGRMIKSFSTNSQASGSHKVVWDGTNNNGVKVSTGIYIYRFEATSFEANKHFVKSEKLLLVK